MFSTYISWNGSFYMVWWSHDLDMNLGMVWECIQKFLDRPPGVRTANGTAFCHYIQLYRYFVSQSSEFFHQNPLCCFLKNVCCCLFQYQLSPETFGYTLINILFKSQKFCHCCKDKFVIMRENISSKNIWLYYDRIIIIIL
jgi:hypothetical protein